MTSQLASTGRAPAALAIILIAAIWFGLFAGALAHRDEVDAQTACRARSGEVLLAADGAWRCVGATTEAR